MIYTFYSYKGGVGRSMALANIAELYYQKGMNVLMIDWDLEAPGLEHFFGMTQNQLHNYLGLSDLIQAYNPQKDFPDISKYLIDMHPENNKNHLWLMPSGKRSNNENDFIYFVRTFDWKQDWVKVFANTLKEILNSQFDIVLIDSRTGFSDSNGVCTYRILDALVTICSCTTQSIDGISILLKQIEDEINNDPKRNIIPLLVIPSRFDTQEMVKEDLNEFEKNFSMTFQPYLSHINQDDSYQSDISLLARIGIPYVPKFSFKEKLAVIEEKNKALTYAYENIIQLMDHARSQYTTFLFYDDNDRKFCDDLSALIEQEGLNLCRQQNIPKKGGIQSKSIDHMLSASQYITIVWSQHFDNKMNNFNHFEQSIWDMAVRGLKTNQTLVIIRDNTALPDVLKTSEKIYDCSNTENQNAYIQQLKRIFKHVKS
jgi:MinD-like ATPase involved in chromosome partitioning or flagellar assembly